MGGDDDIRPALPEALHARDAPLVAAHERWIRWRSERPELTTAPVEVVAKTNRTIDYRVGSVEVHIDLDRGVEISS